jgi:c-di-GMP-binding flagellar brake protein YcgR
MFEVGQPITLDCKGKSPKSFLRGWKMQNGGYLLLDPPSPLNRKLLFGPDAKIVVRMKREGTVYGFVTGPARLLKKTNIMILKLKEDIHEHSIRTEIRFSCFIPAEITSGESNDREIEERGMICDISMSGARFLTPDPLKDEDSIRLTFSLGGEGTIRQKRFKVMRSKIVKGKYMYAGRFLGMGNEDKEKLARFFDFLNEWKLQE